MKKRFFYSIFMALLLVTGCYKEEFGQVEKEMKHLRDTQIAPLSDQVSRISESISTLNVLSDELQEYITQIEQAGDVLQGNIGQINESIQALKESLSGKNSAAKGEVLAKLENTKSYLEVQLADMRSTSDVLKTKYDSLEQQIEALESLVANGYATKDWVKGTFATIDQQNAVIADVEAVKALISELSSSTFEIEGNIKDYIKKLRDAALAEVESSISQNVEALIGSYEMAISNTVSDIKDAYTKEIADAIKKSEDKVMEWVNGELNDYLTISAADAKAEAYRNLIGNVPEGLTLQGQIDTLTGRIKTLKSDITDAYKTAIEEAIETSEGKLTDQLTEGIASFRANDLKAVTDDVASLEDDVKTLWVDLGKLENRIKTLEEQAAAIEGSLDVLKGFHNSLEEYIDALKAELLEKDKTEAATLQKLVEALQYAVNGEDNASSLDAMIAELKAYVGTIPEGEASLVAWVKSSTSLIDTQLEDYATIEYINGLKKAVNDTITDHTRRVEIVSARLATAIDDSKSTIEGWISGALKDYMLASAFNGKLKTLDTDLKSLFTQGDSALNGKISDLRTAVGTAISELQDAYKAKIKSSIEEYNGYVTSSVDKKLSDVKKVLYGEDGKGGINAQFEEFEATIDGMKSDVQTLNTEISSLKAKVDSLKTFITVEGYSSLKGIVNAVDTELGKFSGLYADLTKFNAADLDVNGTGGYKESIDKLVQFKTDLEAAETAIDTYQALLKDFTLTDENKTLKKQFDALTKELSDLKTAVFGPGTGNSLRDKLNAIVTKNVELKGLIDTLNASLLSRVQSFTSIAFIPKTDDGSAKFNFDGKSFSSTLYFAVRPKALSEAIADAAEIQWIHTATRALASLNPAPAEITSPEPGILAADVSFDASAMQGLSKGISLALFASGDGFDFASEFVPVSGDRMYTDKTVLNVPAVGADNLKVKLYYSSYATRREPQTSENWVSVNNGSSAAGVSGLSCREYTVKVSPSKSTSERTATITFTVSLGGGQSLSCSVDVIQAAREATTLSTQDPKISFSWDAKKYKKEGDETWSNLIAHKNNQQQIDYYYIDWDVYTVDGFQDWSVAKSDEADTWFTVTARPEGQQNADKRTSIRLIPQRSDGIARESNIKFTFIAGDPVEWTIKQEERGEQRLTFDPTIESGGLTSFAGTASTESSGYGTLKVTPDDGENDFEVSSDYDWIHWNTGTWRDGVRTMKVWVDKNEDYDTEAGRDGVIKFTTKGINPETYEYPVHQAVGVKQTFTFSPLDGVNCYVGEDGYIHIGYKGGSKMHVYVKGEPNDTWTMSVNDAGTGNWLSRESLTNGSGRSEAKQAPSGFDYYIRISAPQNNGDNDREASIRFTCDGSTYDYKVIQDHKTADITNFDPASGTLVFYWDGRVIGDDGKPTSNTYQDIEVTTGDGSTTWTVDETPDISWAKTEKRTYSNANKVRISEVAENKTGEDRIGTLTFTSATNKTYTYTFIQQKATQTTATVTIGGTPVEKIILNWNGKYYKVSDDDTEWKEITTREVDDKQTFLATVTTDDGSEWNAALDPTKTSSGWGIAAEKVEYRWQEYLGISAYGSNTTGNPRSAEIVISNGLGEICRIPVVQETRPPQSFSFNPGLTFPDSKAGSITTTVTPVPDLDNDEWDVDNGTIEWLTVERVTTKKWQGGKQVTVKTNQIKLTATKNNSAEPRTAELVITYEGGSAKYTVTQPGREAQTFTKFDPGSGTVNFSWDGYLVGRDGKSTSSTTQDITVTTSDGLNEWSVVTTDTDWAKVNKQTGYGNTNKARISEVAQNETGEDRTGTLTFTSETGVTETYTFTQKARPAQTFKSITPSVDGNEFNYSSQSKEITVVTNDGLNDYTVAVSGTGVSYSKAENKVTLTLAENTSGEVINGSITFTSHGGSDVRTMSFTQNAKPSSITLNVGTLSEFPYAGSTQKLTVSTTPSGFTNWTVEKKELASEDNTWLSFEKLNDGVNVTASANTGEARSTGLLLKSPTGEEYPVTVSQAKNNLVITLDPETLYFSADGEKYKTSEGGAWQDVKEALNSRGRFDYYYAPVDVSLSDGSKNWSVDTGGWSAGALNSNGTLRVKTSALSSWSSEKPSGKVTVKSSNGVITKDLTIIQNRPLTVVLPKTTTQSSRTFTITVKSDESWQASTPRYYHEANPSVSKSDSPGETELTITGVNDSTPTRVQFTDGSGSSVTVEIKRGGRNGSRTYTISII